MPLDEEGFPVFEKKEGHGYGLLSIQHITQKYGGMVKILVDDGVFNLVAVMFRKTSGGHDKKDDKSHVVLRSAAGGVAFLMAGILSLNCMPYTIDALEKTPFIGKTIEIIDFRNYGWQWGDSKIQINKPVTNVPSAEEIINGYVEECKALFNSYYLRKYNGYVAAEFSSEEIVNDDEIYVLRMSYLLQVGNSAEYFRYFIVNKSTGKILELSDLFKAGSDYESVLVNEILRQMEKGVTENYDSYFGFGIFDDEPRLSELKDPNFYLDKNHALVIVFDENQIAPGNMGSPSFTIGYPAIESILAENSLIKAGT